MQPSLDIARGAPHSFAPGDPDAALADRDPDGGGWCAVVLAGQRPGRDPLCAAFGIATKSLISIHGSPMLAWVLRTLAATPAISRIVILAQDVSLLAHEGMAEFRANPRISILASDDGIARSIQRYAGTPVLPWPMIVTTADHPLLTREMVETVIAAAAGADVAVAAVERRDVMRRYPDSRRTWLRFKGGAYSGANLFALSSAKAGNALERWSKAEKDRKEALKLFWHFGPILALRAILRLITFENALAKAGRSLQLKARLVALRDAEAAIDVDKPSDYELVEKILSSR